SWLTDQVGAASAGANTYDFTTALPNALDGDGLLGTLYVSATMFYIQEVPNNDGWGNAYEYRYATNILGAQVMGIRSTGRDGTFSGGSYTMGPFVATLYDSDIVWADGFFVRYPAGAKTQ
ncbi:MAG: hypothetical protein V3T81_05115, partial [Thermoanaerobaculia bacterium]